LASEDILRQAGLKATPQRLAIYGFLRDNRSHPRVEHIYRQLRQTYPSLSLATVYKTLESLVEVGLASAFNVGEGSFRFDLNTAPHSHLICRSCHQVQDLDDRFLPQVVAQVQEASGYRLDGQATYYYGHCPVCQKGGGGGPT
jgi:Fur family peroxide stress response transcriptional regulator